MAGRLVILAGPSCMGKTPLARVLGRFYPDLYQQLQPIVLYNSRPSRPGEVDGVDYHFRTTEQVEALRKDDRYVVMRVRNDMQSLDLKQLSEMLGQGDALFEGSTLVGHLLLTHAGLAEVRRLSMFVSPLSKEEISFLRDQANVSLPDLVADVMRRKLLRRTRREKRELSLKDLQDIEKRATSAYEEMKLAHHFDYIIPCYDGEDSDNWEAFHYPIGDARQVLFAVAAILRGESPPRAETWEDDLLV
jgi:guanylate kinase